MTPKTFLLHYLIVNLLSFNHAQRLGSRKTRADGGDLTEDDKKQLLDIHNTYRSATALGNTGSQPAATNMLELIWDEDLAIGAKAHADKCEFEHESGDFGENLFVSGSSEDVVDNIEELIGGVGDWQSEHEFYTYDSDSCSGVCTHYTQNVWDNTRKVGCGYAVCSGIFDLPYEVYLVCRYDPPGNWFGEKPYDEASSKSDVASNCPSGYIGDSTSGLCKEETTTPPSPVSSPLEKCLEALVAFILACAA